jgi:predicted RNA binding protein YcfA (HicA-like mRNA interferase family)
MKLPRDLSGAELIDALRALDYRATRQNGSHIRITTQRGGEHHEVIPNHSPIKIGTLSSILKSVAAHHKMTVPDLLREIGF